jgi:hypothetical protein
MAGMKKSKGTPKPMRLDPKVKKSGLDGGKLGERGMSYKGVKFERASSAEQRRRVETYGPLALGLGAAAAGGIAYLSRMGGGGGKTGNKTK